MSGPMTSLRTAPMRGRRSGCCASSASLSREALAIRLARTLKAPDVIDALADLFILRGVPAHIRSDNGSVFVDQALRDGIDAAGAKAAYIEPGSPLGSSWAAPWENGYRESFNGKLRDELLNGEIFYTGGSARDRSMAAPLQRCPPALVALISASSTGGLHPRAPAFAIWASLVGHAHAGANAGSKLTFQLDHSMRAGHSKAARAGRRRGLAAT